MLTQEEMVSEAAAGGEGAARGPSLVGGADGGRRAHRGRCTRGAQLHAQHCIRVEGPDAASSTTPIRRCACSPPPKPVEYALVPADAEPVEPRLEITGAPTFDTAGQIYFVTITQPKISMLDWFVTRDNDAARFLSERDKNGDQSEQQIIQSGQQQMRSAKDNAVYVALKAAGYPWSCSRAT
jgi:hypothetical protein